MIRLMIAPVISVMLFASGSFAGDARGNGGHGVVCRDAQANVLSVEILDFYEASEMRGIERSLGEAGLAVSEKIEIALKRIDRFEHRAQRYRVLVEAFEANALFKHGITLVNVPDTNHLAFPRGCGVEQIVNQRQPRFPEDKLYVVNADLWDQLDNDNKAGLILHEVIFGELIDEGQTTSDGARYFNSYISSTNLDSWYDRMQYYNLLKRSGYKDFWWFNLPFEFPDPLLCSEGGCRINRGVWWTSKVTRPMTVSIGPDDRTVYFTLVLTRGCDVDLDQNGRIREGCFVVPENQPSGIDSIDGEKLHLWFDEGGKLIQRDLDPRRQNQFEVGVSGWLEAKGRIGFFASKKVRRLQLLHGHSVQTKGGPKEMAENTIITFDETGMALDWFMPH